MISTQYISEFWEEEPPDDVLSVIISRRSSGLGVACGVDGGRLITPLCSGNMPSSRETNLSAPLWLIDLHTKLWGKRQLFDEIFRTATLTKADFIELQHQLHRHDPERNSESYVVRNVLTIKADFLRSRSSADSTASAAHFDAAPNDNLVPKLVFNTTHDVTPPMLSDAVDAAAIDAPTMHADTMDVVPDPDSYIEEDANYLSTGDAAIFPCTIRYMDLRVLELTHFTRIPELILLRNEWGNMVDIFNKRKKGIGGSAVFTGQPGIGEYCYCFKLVLPTNRLNFERQNLLTVLYSNPLPHSRPAFRLSRYGGRCFHHS